MPWRGLPASSASPEGWTSGGQRTLNDALKGRYRKFTIDRLVRMLSGVGKRVDITVTDKAA